MELTQAELKTIAEALRVYRDRYYRHPSQRSYEKNRVIFNNIDNLRTRIQTEQAKKRDAWVFQLTQLLEESDN